MNKKALLTGATGQDGSYLAELLLSKGYEVHGIIRRASTFNTDRIDHLYKDPHDPSTRMFLWYGDLADSTGLRRLLEKVRPDEVYNLGAQSHVKVSFDEPEYTVDVTGLGCLRILEALRDYQDRTSHQVRFYQASSSEMFGSAPPPQSLATPFHPRSPYACAKVYAFWQTVNHRESYDLFACNGVLFNHECLSANTPLLVRRGSSVDVCTPDELIPVRRKGSNVQSFTPSDVDLWDGERWTPLRAITATKRRPADPDHALLSIQARAGVVDVTAHHHMLDHQREMIRADRLQVGGRLALAASYPPSPAWTVLSAEMAEFLGHMAAEGYVARERGAIQYTNNDEKLRARVAELWSKLFLGQSHEWQGASGFSSATVGQLRLNGVRSLHEWLREQLYTKSGLKKVPPLVLNAPLDIQRAFLEGYYAGDGLKAGNGDAFKTNSAPLAQGLCWLYGLQGRSCSVCVERRGENAYYQVNLSTAEPQGQKGQHLRKEPAELRRVDPAQEWDDWVFDVETGSGMLCAGVGRVVVHNSPRRGETFVTRKITRAVGRIKLGLQEKLYLGNLDAKRDWGHARDYVEAMWLMLQRDKPRDFVVATGEAYSVREFAERAFSLVGLDARDFIQVDPRYFRPAEVDFLQGDPRDTNEVLGWKPRTSFDELVREMVEHDLEQARQERTLRDAGHQIALRGVGNT